MITYQVLQMAVIVTRSLGCDSSLTKLGDAVVANESPNPSTNRLTTNMANAWLSHCRIAPMIMMILPTVIPHRRPYLSATQGAMGVEHTLPRDMMALMSPSCAPRGRPK